MRLANRLAVVTGGGSGIGAEICQAFAKESASVAVADINSEAAVVVDRAFSQIVRRNKEVKHSSASLFTLCPSPTGRGI